VDAELAVVGASFAGIACAVAAARAGLRVVLLERKSDPGMKLHTTGIVVKEALASLAQIDEVPEALLRSIRGVRLYAPNLHSIALDSAGYFFLATDTPNLMRWLVERTASAGVDIRLGLSFANARRLSDGIEIADLGRVRFVVGADGPVSKVAEIFELDRNRDFLAGVEAEVEGLTLPEADRLHCFLDRRLAPGYIGWAFMGVGIAQIGLAGRRSATFANADVEPFLARLRGIFDLSTCRVMAKRGGLIPVGGALPKTAGERVLLVGDAAGLVSPLTAGGIHTALESGRAAGLAIASALASDIGGTLSVRIPVPRFRYKRLMRVAFDRFPSDRMFNLLMRSGMLTTAARLVYFHRRGLFSAAAWRDLVARAPHK